LAMQSQLFRRVLHLTTRHNWNRPRVSNLFLTYAPEKFDTAQKRS